MKLKIATFKVNQIGLDEKQKRTRIYFSPENETVLENFISGRHSRPHLELKKLIPELMKRMNVKEEVKVKWSQYAGCNSCPCSPGFIVTSHNLYGLNIFVDYKDADYEAGVMEAEVASEGRAYGRGGK